VIARDFFIMTDYSNIPDCFYRVSIKALVLDEKGRFLLCREDDNRWDFPGGGYDHADSSPREALIRELREEMGVEMATMEDTPSYFVTAKHRKGFFLANVFYKTTLKNLDITPSDECQEVQFFTPEEALKMELFPNVIEFCKQYKI
jgi:8-oxo-dGTP pyrophosphatase MutT (NUDIX family)